MREVAFRKVSQVMTSSPLVFSSTDTVSEFLGYIRQPGLFEALVVFRNKIGVVTARDILDVMHPERTLLGKVARRISPLGKEATVLDAVDLMFSNRVKTIPVAEDGRIVGAVSSIGVVEALISSPAFQELTCGDVMRLPIASVKEDDQVSTVRVIMREYDVGDLPVVNYEGELKGVVTARDMALRLLQPEESMTQGDFDGESVRAWGIPVGDLMDTNPLTARAEDPIVDLFRSFKRLRKETCMVVGSTGLLNIVTPMEMIAPLTLFRFKERIHVYILGLPETGDFLDAMTIQDKIYRTLGRGIAFRDDIREVVVDVKRRKRNGTRVLYQVKANVYSSTKPLTLTAHGWYLAEVFDELCRMLDRALVRSKKRGLRPRDRRETRLARRETLGERRKT